MKYMDHQNNRTTEQKGWKGKSKICLFDHEGKQYQSKIY